MLTVCGAKGILSHGVCALGKQLGVGCTLLGDKLNSFESRVINDSLIPGRN